GIAGGKRREYEEAICRNAEEHIDLLAFEIGAELQIVMAVRHCDGIGALVVILMSVLRAGDGVTERCVTAHDQKGDALIQRQCGLVVEAEAAARGMVDGLSVEERVP